MSQVDRSQSIGIASNLLQILALKWLLLPISVYIDDLNNHK